MKALIILIFSFVSLTSFGQVELHKDPLNFLTEDYMLFDSIFGDLNNDGQEDCVLIIKKMDTNQIVINRFDQKVDRNRRGIIVLFKKADGYEIADQNYDCFSSENEDGGVYFPPQLSIDVKKNKLYIHYGHGRYGSWKYTFRYQDGSFKLIGYDGISSRGPVIEKEKSINFLSKKKLVKENTNLDAEGGDEVFRETWSDIEIENLIQLSDIDDFDELVMYSY